MGAAMLGSPTDTNTQNLDTGGATSLVGRLYYILQKCETNEQTAMTV